jgi:hypothetical protein
MTDIVERLAQARNMIELERAAADAIDEIERQEQTIERLGRESASDHNRWATERINLLTEIERLRNQLQVSHAETLEWLNRYNECEKPDERDAEIERLSKENAMLREQRDRAQATVQMGVDLVDFLFPRRPERH